MPPPPKRRRVDPAIAEITFDTAARQDWLTGFHKRKLQRAKHAQEVAKEKERVERIKDRAKLREQRKADLEAHVQEVNALMNPTVGGDQESEGDSGETEEWEGLPSPEPPEIDHEAEYIDEDKYTTVTVEAMDVSKEGLFKAEQERDRDGRDDEDKVEDKEPNGKSGRDSKPKRTWTKDKPAERPKKKRKNFRYESKAERQFTRKKQNVKNSEQARARRER